MKINKHSLEGAFVIDIEPVVDHRGAFARTFCAEEFRKHGLEYNMVQSNISITLKRNTIRGMHFQLGEAQEAKLVRCIRGAILDVIIDIRKDSDTYAQHFMIELTSSNNKMLYVPRGIAHGFLTLEDDCHVFYQVSNFYAPNKENGIRWNDPFFNIRWPISNPILSEKDASYEDFLLK